VKAAEGCRSPKRWRVVPRVDPGEAFGVRETRTTDWDVRLGSAQSKTLARDFNAAFFQQKIFDRKARENQSIRTR
jgi:hypothetical protein